MSKIRILTILAIASIIPASVAIAQSASGSGGTDARGAATSVPQGAAVSGTARADVGAKVQSDDALRHRIEARAARVSARDLEQAQAKIDESEKDVDATAQAQGDAAIAGRLATEFNMTSDAILAEKQSLDASWGNLMIAHAIAANSKTDVTVESLLGMQRDGMGWGRIAAGLDLRLGSVVSAVKSEGQVAAGRAKASGHVAAMRGPGARAAGIGTGLHAGVGAGHAGAAAGAGVHAGVKIKP